MDIKNYRDKLDVIDDRIAALFKERLEVVREIGLWKKSCGSPTLHGDREKAILSRLLPRFDEGLKGYAEQLYLEIFRSSKEYQRGLLGTYYVVGKSLKHTWSPDIYVPLGLDYRVKEFADENELAEFVKRREYSGFNVTIPYKKAVMKMLDEISEEARAIGAVNTVVNRNGKLYGYNTDIGGMRYALKAAGIEVQGKAVAVLGSGGTAMTAEYLLRTGGAREIVKVSRRGPVDYISVYDRKDIEVILNTTPVGMFPEAESTPIDVTKFPALEGVFDAIYNPLRTALVSGARAAGIAASGGLPMLVEQGRLAYNIYRDTETDISVTENLIKQIELKKSNIILCGMPSSGKTTIGRLLAEALGREFYDADEEIEKAAGMGIPEMFERFGEEYFRKKEVEAIASLSALNGAVIATGGGAVMNEINRMRLKRNGIVVLIERDNAALVADGRPVSRREGIEALYNKRMPVYREFADLSVSNDSAPEDAVKSIIRRVFSV